MTWQLVETAPADVDVQLGWLDWNSRQWTQKVGYAKCTKGGWLDGQATHWMPLPEPPNNRFCLAADCQYPNCLIEGVCPEARQKPHVMLSDVGTADQPQ